MEGFDLSSSASDGNNFGKYEIALLCLGMLHVHFGHPKLALEVLTESVHVSQQHVQRPMLCFGPKASVNLKTCPPDVFQELRLSSHVISDVGSESSEITRDGVFATTWLKNSLKTMSSLITDPENRSENNNFEFCAQQSSIPRPVLQSLGSSYLVRATAWEMYGSTPLARINAIVYASCCADASSLDNLALSCVKLVQHLATFKGYKDAYVAFRIVEQKFDVISKSRISLLKLQLLHEHALHRGHLKLAQQVCDELGALASSVTGVDADIKTEASLRQARTLLAANQFSQAAQVAHSLFSTCYKFNLQVENSSVLLFLAEIHKKAGNAALGLPYALASILFCQAFNLDLLKASATLTLVELWLMFGPSEAQRALSLLHGVFPMILGHGGLELCARAHITEAKCRLSDPSYSVHQDPNAVLNPLMEACDNLELLEYHELAAEGFYLMAMIYDKIGKLQERETASSSFKKHVTALKNPQNSEITPSI